MEAVESWLEGVAAENLFRQALQTLLEITFTLGTTYWSWTFCFFH